MSRVTKLPYLDSLQVSETTTGAPLASKPPAAAPKPLAAAGAPLSPALEALQAIPREYGVLRSDGTHVYPHHIRGAIAGLEQTIAREIERRDRATNDKARDRHTREIAFLTGVKECRERDLRELEAEIAGLTVEPMRSAAE